MLYLKHEKYLKKGGYNMNLVLQNQEFEIFNFEVNLVDRCFSVSFDSQAIKILTSHGAIIVSDPQWTYTFYKVTVTGRKFRKNCNLKHGTIELTGYYDNCTLEDINERN